jgi:hypothetical protein
MVVVIVPIERAPSLPLSDGTHVRVKLFWLRAY